MAANPESYLDRLANDADLTDRVNTIRQRISDITQIAPIAEQLEAGANTYDVIANLILVSLNGQAGILEQKVQVEYLRNEQRLLIPTALAMSPAAGPVGRAPANAVLVDRYWRATTLTYPEIRALVLPQHAQNEVRAAVDARPLAQGAGLFAPWGTDAWSAGDDTRELTDMVMGAFSAALQFNCDIRDVGILNMPDMSVPDNAWTDAKNVNPERLRNKLRAYSITNIAALNLPCTANFELAALVRAYGLGIGILPAVGSRTQVEWMFTARQPAPANINAIIAYMKRFQRSILSLCANILAMFGLFHLAKDHTFRTGDVDMTRIATSYIQALRTCVTVEEQDLMIQHMEATVRTGPHPFGLAQTYWLALSMGQLGFLTSPLAIRVNVSPPPVQRLMIARATSKEWHSLPAGRIIDRLFNEGYTTMDEQIVAIQANAPAYSGLHRLYGIDQQLFVSAACVAYVESMMPTVYGYIMVAHTTINDQKDGLAYALSLKNISRDQKGMTSLWTNVWAKYVDEIENMGLAEFVERMRVSMAKSVPVPAPAPAPPPGPT